jgi:xanthine dehydrogenase accessory factor
MRQRAAALEAAGVAFVEATVVRCAAPTSARPGDRAIVLGDGTIEGFVGGSCADQTVRLQSLRVLETGEPLLLRILPGDQDGPSDEDGAVVVANPCLSGGALELFLEPHVPAPVVAIAGESPVARALAELCAPLGFRARLGAHAEPGDFGAVVASLGHDDEQAVARALEAGCEYVGLVASRVRGAAVLEALEAAGADAAALARVRTPAGVDIRARTHAEIALSILAELVAARRAPAVPTVGGATADARAARDGEPPAPRGEAAVPARPREAGDPICGMKVLVGPDTPTAGGEAFCSAGCREAWLARTA